MPASTANTTVATAITGRPSPMSAASKKATAMLQTGDPQKGARRSAPSGRAIPVASTPIGSRATVKMKAAPTRPDTCAATSGVMTGAKAVMVTDRANVPRDSCAS
jgi:hypothetical protein